MDKTVVNQLVKKHFGSALIVAVALFALPRLVTRLFLPEYGSYTSLPLAVGFLFSIVEIVAVVCIWKWVVLSHADMLVTFHTASSGFRLLLVLIVMLVVYINVGKESVMPYLIWLMLFYFAELIVHSYHFSKASRVLLEKQN